MKTQLRCILKVSEID